MKYTAALSLTFVGFTFVALIQSAIVAQEHTKDSLDQIKKNLQEKKAILLDVREKNEWDEGHLKSAQLLPLSKLKADLKLTEILKDLKPGTIVYCHCRAGKRALDAAELLKKGGYDARAIKSGYEELVKSGIDEPNPPTLKQGATPKTVELTSGNELFDGFKKTMSGVKLVGQFTVTGSDDKPPSKEEYTITSVSKMPDGDKWLFMARIKYGKHDLTVPLPLDVKWADKTPVITLDELTIPGLGTFSSRVVIDSGKYAGTWTHGKVGGHLFGVIEPANQEGAK